VFQIDNNQFKALFQLFLRLDFNRGRSGKSKKQFVRMLIFYGFLGGTLSGSLLNQTSPIIYTFIAFSYLMLMAASAVLLELGQEMVMPEEFETLGYFPIPSHTYFAAKLAHILFYTGLISASLSIFPAGLGLLLPGSDWRFPVTFILGGLSAGVFSAALMGLLMAFLIRFMETERLKNMVAIFQVSLTLGLVFLFQLIPRATDSSTNLFNTSLSSWMNFLPPAWFTNLVLKLSGHEIALSWMQILLVITITGIILLTGLYRMGRLYSYWISSNLEVPNTHKQKSSRRTMIRVPVIQRLFHRNSELNAGYMLTVQMLKRDRAAKMTIFPILGISLAFLVRAVLEPQFIDPFVYISGFDTDISSNLFFYFLFAGIPLILTLLTYSRDWQAAWIYSTAPIRQPYRLIQGMRFAVLQFLLIPFFILMAVILSFKIPFIHAIQHALFLSISGLTVYSLLGIGMRYLPFSRERQQINRLKRLMMLMLAIPVFICVRFLQQFSYSDSAHYWSIIVIFIGILIILEWFMCKWLGRDKFLSRLVL